MGGVELTALAFIVWGPGGSHFPLPGLALYFAAFSAYALAAWIVSFRDTDEGLLPWIWAVAIVLRVVVLPSEPSLTDDFWRYLWDGHVQRAGMNPYLFAPGALEVAHLTTPWHHLINNPAVPTIYPPVAQYVFHVIAVVGSYLPLPWHIVAMKAVWVGCDLATAFVIVRIARMTGRRPTLSLLLYAWAPLLVVDVAGNAHLETLGLLWLALAILATVDPVTRARGAWAGTALGLAALTKIAPIAALPALVRRAGITPLVAFGSVVLIAYLPYLDAGGRLFAGLSTYSEHWWFMKGAFSLFEIATADPIGARRLSAVGVVLVIGWTMWRSFDLERALLWTLGTGMLLTPTLHPWYVLWLLPMAALRVSRPWLLLCGLPFLGYFGLTTYHATGTWPQPGWLRAAMWLPVWALLLAEGIQGLSSAEGAERGVPTEEEEDEGKLAPVPASDRKDEVAQE